MTSFIAHCSLYSLGLMRARLFKMCHGLRKPLCDLTSWTQFCQGKKDVRHHRKLSDYVLKRSKPMLVYETMLDKLTTIISAIDVCGNERVRVR